MDNFSALLGKKLAGSGGGSGTSNYNELENKPQINGNTLSGNKTAANLGLQSAINQNNKIDADLLDDSESEKKLVSENDISNWNNKYDSDDAYTKAQTDTAIETAIAALDVAETGGSGKYISAISETNGKIAATPITFDTALSSSSTNNNAPTSKTVYDDQQRQEVEIGAVANAGAKNFAVPFDPISTTDIIVTRNANGSYTFECTDVSENRIIRVANIGNMPSGTFKISGVTGGSSSTYMLGLYDTSATAKKYQHTNPEESYTGDVSGFSLRVRVIAGYSGTFTVYPMIRPASITDSTFQPYALPNPTLTPAAIKAVDEGAKNFLDISVSTLKKYNTVSSAVWDGPSYTQNGITYAVNSDGTISVSGMATSTSFMVLANRTYLNTKITRGRYSISGCPTGGGSSGDTYRIFCLNPNANISNGYTDTGNGYIGEFYYDNSKDCNIAIGVGAGCVITDPVVFKPMLCTAADWAVSQKFVPYCPTLYELYQMVLDLQSGTRSLSLSAPSENLSKGAIDITAEEEPETLKSEVEKTGQEAEPEIEEKEGADER